MIVDENARADEYSIENPETGEVLERWTVPSASGVQSTQTEEVTHYTLTPAEADTDTEDNELEAVQESDTDVADKKAALRAAA